MDAAPASTAYDPILTQLLELAGDETLIDATLATPYNLRPIDFGVDFVLLFVLSRPPVSDSAFGRWLRVYGLTPLFFYVAHLYVYAAMGLLLPGKTSLLGMYPLWALGVAAVISGDFSGWNLGFSVGGWGGMFLGAIVITIMYLGLTYSIADGLALGFISYPIIKALSGRLRETSWLSSILALVLIAYFVFVRGEMG